MSDRTDPAQTASNGAGSALPGFHDTYRLYPQRYDWVAKCPPRCGCTLGQRGCRFCRSDFCIDHGQYQRIADRNRIGDRPDDGSVALAVVLNFGVLMDSKIASFARKMFLKCLCRVMRCEYLWRWEWKDFRPHLNLTILCYACRASGSPSRALPRAAPTPITTAVSPSAAEAATLVKSCAREVYEYLGLGEHKRARSYAQEVEDWQRWHDYIFKVAQVVPESECPPVMKRQRWWYWDTTKEFPLRRVEARS